MSSTLRQLNAPIARVDLEDVGQSGDVLATDQSPESIAAAAEHFSLAYARIDLASATTKLAFLRAVADALSFPSHFGENWDALYDCLTSLERIDDTPIERGVLLLFDDAAAFATAAPDDFADACAVLRAAADDWKEDEVAFWILVRGL